MEIRDYLRLIRRRWWILVVIPTVAGGASYALVSDPPKSFRTEGVVAVPGLFDAVGETEQFVADFSGIATSTIVLEEIAGAYDVSPSRIADHLQVERVGESSLVELTLTTRRSLRDAAPKIVEDVALRALTYLLDAEVALAEGEFAAARGAHEEAVKSINDFTEETGSVLPDETYRATQTELSQLRVRLAQAQSEGEVEQVELLRPEVDARELILIAVGPQVVRYQALVDARTRTSEWLRTAQTELASARARNDVGTAREAVTVGEPVDTTPVTADLARRVAAVLAASLLLAVGVVLLLELSTRHPEGKAGADDEGSDRTTGAELPG